MRGREHADPQEPGGGGAGVRSGGQVGLLTPGVTLAPGSDFGPQGGIRELARRRCQLGPLLLKVLT